MSTHGVSRGLLPAALAFVCAGCSVGGSFERLGLTQDKLAPTGAFARLVVDLPMGSVVVRESNVAEIEVQAEVLVRGALADRLRAEIGHEPQLQSRDWFVLVQEGDTVALRDARSDADHELRLRVRLPRGPRALDLHVGIGSIDAEIDAATAITTRVDIGSVKCRASQVAGPLRGEVATGELQADVGAVPAGGVDVSVSTGAVRLGLPTDAAGDFDLHVDVGGLSGLDRFGLEQQRSITSASASGRRGSGGPTLKARVGTGEIALR